MFQRLYQSRLRWRCICKCAIFVRTTHCKAGIDWGPVFKFEVCTLHMHFNVKGFKIITLHSDFQTFLQHFTRKQNLILVVLYRIWKQYHVSLYWWSTCNKLMHQKYLDILHNAPNHHPAPKAKPSNFWSIFKCPKVLAQSIFSIGRPHDNARINASNVSSFNRLLWSLFTRLCLENPRSHIVVLAKPKLQSVLSQIWRVIGIWKCLLYIVPRLESSYKFTNYSHCILWHAIFGESFTV